MVQATTKKVRRGGPQIIGQLPETSQITFRVSTADRLRIKRVSTELGIVAEAGFIRMAVIAMLKQYEREMGLPVIEAVCETEAAE